MITSSPYWDYIELEPIRVSIQIDAIDEATLRRHLEDQTEEMQRSRGRGSKVYLIIESRDPNRPPPEVRKLQAEWMEQHRELIADTCLGMGFVMDNRLVRGALTAIFWVTRPPVPYKVHPTLTEALEHALGVCDKLGVELPPEARRPDAALRVESAFDRVMARRIAL